MKKIQLITEVFVSLLLSISPGISQEVWTPFEFKSAIESGTRTSDGTPGENYWINHSDYDLDVKIEFLNDTCWISGSAMITYFNNSPDDLNMLVIRSYPDFFADAAVRNYYIFPQNETRQVEYSDLIVNKDTIPSSMLMQRRTSTNLMVQLPESLGSGKSVDLQIKWKYFMHPSINIRQGVFADDAIFIAYFYPQIAVYDDIYGWDMTDYMGIVEFYNDFNNYSVDITLPAGYLVSGAGTLENPEEVYPEDLFQKYQNGLKSDEIVKLITENDLPVDHGNREILTWKYSSQGSPDFSFAASKTHLWDASGLEVEPGRRVLISTVYPKSSRHYNRGAEFSRNAIKYLSFTSPGVPYPWPSMTVFNSGEGGGGMETPMMVNNGDQATEIMADEIIFHEIAHSYLPFITGTNERRFAWMDEGWATYQGMKWTEGDPGGTSGQFGGVFSVVAGSSNDVPLMVPTYSIFDPLSSNFNSYVRSSQAFLTIENLLGKQVMNRAWNIFTERWKFKHPTPWDLFAIFEEVAGQDLDWLFIPWYYEFKYADLAIESVDPKEGNLTVRNIGGLPLPVHIKLNFTDGNSTEIELKPSVFKNKDVIIVDFNKIGDLESIELGNIFFFDVDASNNSWTKN